MSGIVVSLVLTCLVTGPLWFLLGSRFKFSAETEENDILNLAAYAAAVLPVAFLFVYFVLDLK